ncbi:MAG: RNB domain-containing ribonuclease [Deltaproteobacteria bacterium]|nr:RNB domain-containing ribonuclease [Deltaproteobacteria bacterium]
MSQPDPSQRAVVGRMEEGRLVDPWNGEESWSLEGESSDGSWLRASVAGGLAEPEANLAEPGSALAAVYELAARKAPRSPLHSSAALREAQAWVKNPAIDDPSLEDLTGLPLVTIDEEDSKDLDQAVCIEERQGGFRVWYAIADAAHFVRPGTALWSEALARGSTYYLPGLVIPMLPRELSEYLVSLHLQENRRALMFRVDLGADGEVSECRISRARVRSRVKTSYDAVQDFFDGKAKAPGGDPEVSRSLELLQRVGELRLALAEARDILQIRRQEVRINLGQKPGFGFIAMTDDRIDAERYNEQISLLCNMEGARFLRRGRGDDRLQAIYRYHQAPDGERLAQLQRQIGALTQIQGKDPAQWAWQRGRQSLAAYLRSLPSTGDGSRIAKAIHRQAMLAGGRSGFDSEPGIHHGVGADVYARFTAPMREVVGVFVHKESWERLGLASAGDLGRDQKLRQAVVAAAERSRQVQREIDRELNREVLDQMFSRDLDLAREDRPTHRGTVLGISRSKVHVQLDQPAIDVKIYQHHLEEEPGGENLHAGRDGVTLRRSRDGEVLWSVGAEVQLRLRGHDTARDRWRLELLPASA